MTTVAEFYVLAVVIGLVPGRGAGDLALALRALRAGGAERESSSDSST